MTTVGYGDKAPVTLRGRLVALFWMFSSLIMISGFTAAIAASLTVGSLSCPVQGPADLAKRGIRVGSVRGSSTGDWLTEKRLRFIPYKDVNSALAALNAGRLDAVVYDEPILRYLDHEEQGGGSYVLPRHFHLQQYAFGVPSRSSLRERLDRSMLRQRNTDEWEDIVFRYIGKRL